MDIPFYNSVKVPMITGWQDKPISGRVLYVDSQHYLDKIYKPRFDKMEHAFKELRQGDTILLYGKIDESGLVGPDRTVTDVTICGMSTRTRPGHGETSAMGGGADWSAEKDNETTPLLTIISQGWSIKNIHFGGGRKASTIKLSRTGDMSESGSHAEFRNVAFSGGMIGIEDWGGCTNIGIFDSQFYGYKQETSFAVKATAGGLAVSWPLMWEISGNRFINNYGHIDVELSNSIISKNYFFRQGFDSTNQVSIDLSGGKNNIVAQNRFGCRSDEPGYVNSAYLAGEGDCWGPNYCSDKTIFGLPKE